MSKSRATTFLAIALALLPAGVEAQGAHVSAAVDSLRAIQSMAPNFGPVGTEVRLSTLNLPVQAKVHVGYGATRTGFEALFETPQGMWGDIEAVVTVPPTAPTDRAILFVAFNAIFSPIALSEPFHVLDDEGLVRRTGTVVAAGASCLTLRDQDGYVYALRGDLAGSRAGDEVVVDGTYAPEGGCAGGQVIGVTRISPVGG